MLKLGLGFKVRVSDHVGSYSRPPPSCQLTSKSIATSKPCRFYLGIGSFTEQVADKVSSFAEFVFF